MSTATPDLSDFTPDTHDLSDFKADSPTSAPAQPSAMSRFWAGMQHGTGDNSDTPPSHGTLTNPDFADNPMVPGSGMYRDIKAGNYAGAAGRVAGPAAELALMFGMGGGGKGETPMPERVPLWKQTGIEPGAPPSNIQTSTPEAIQAQVQRMANRAASVKQSSPVAAKPNDPLLSQSQQIPAGKLPISKGDPYAGPRTPASMQPAQSTTIGLHGYEPTSQTMMVQFKNGRVYEYRGVPPEIYSQYQQAESQGSFFANNIKGRYQTNFRGTVKPTAGARTRQALSSP